jgi:tRNA (uracil-5-)-methyltransferase
MHTRRIWRQGEERYYALFDPQTKKPIFLDEYKLASQRINVLMKELMEILKTDKELSTKLFQVRA